MDFDAVARRVKGVPHTRPEQGRVLYDHVLRAGVDVLELGFAHGVSTCYMAAALDELGHGRVTTIDRRGIDLRRPSIYELLEDLGLGDVVDVRVAGSSYTWELMRLIEGCTEDGVCRPRYGFAFIDGAHLWEPDGLAFFLVDKLLRPGGWIVFDDMDWTIARSRVADTPAFARLPRDEQETPQVQKVFDLLVRQHPSYGAFYVRDGWGWSCKAAGASDSAVAGVRALYDDRPLPLKARSLLHRRAAAIRRGLR